MFFLHKAPCIHNIRFYRELHYNGPTFTLYRDCSCTVMSGVTKLLFTASVSLIFVKIIVSNVITTVLEYRGISSDPNNLPAFPDLLWDLRDMRKISEDIDIAVNLYEFARYKPGVSMI